MPAVPVAALRGKVWKQGSFEVQAMPNGNGSCGAVMPSPSTLHARKKREPEVPGDAFVLVILPPGPMPEPEANYPLTDRYYPCLNVEVCGCPLDFTKRNWKVEYLLPGERFDGRVSGVEADRGDYINEYDRMWYRNLVRPEELHGPVSAYAVVTPDALWHECIFPEPQDLLFDDDDWRERLQGAPELSSLQVAWRLEVRSLLQKHWNGWVLGCEAHLTSIRQRLCERGQLGAPT
jgi:hypothetical protein